MKIFIKKSGIFLLSLFTVLQVHGVNFLLKTQETWPDELALWAVNRSRTVALTAVPFCLLSQHASKKQMVTGLTKYMAGVYVADRGLETTFLMSNLLTEKYVKRKINKKWRGTSDVTCSPLLFNSMRRPEYQGAVRIIEGGVRKLEWKSVLDAFFWQDIVSYSTTLVASCALLYASIQSERLPIEFRMGMATGCCYQFFKHISDMYPAIRTTIRYSKQKNK